MQQIITFAADESYVTPHVAGVPQFENAKQVVALRRNLVGVYAFNSSADTVFLAVWDTANAGTDAGKLRVFPVYAGSYLLVGWAGGKRMENGIYLKAFTSAALAVAAGNVMFYDVEFMAYH